MKFNYSTTFIIANNGILTMMKCKILFDDQIINNKVTTNLSQSFKLIYREWVNNNYIFQQIIIYSRFYLRGHDDNSPSHPISNIFFPINLHFFSHIYLSTIGAQNNPRHHLWAFAKREN